MSVKLRLQRHGRKAHPYFHIVVADARSPRDGKFIERIGFYNPNTNPATIELDTEKAYEWLVKGAQPTDTVNAILGYKGVLMWKHLMRGVRKGALSEDQAKAKHEEFMAHKTKKVEFKEQTVAKALADKHEAIVKAVGKSSRRTKVQEEAGSANVETETSAEANESAE
jgi:small subunit ribosomal protein S16